MFELFDLAVRSGLEYINMEISWFAEHILNLVSKKGQTKVIASWHNWSGKLAWDGTEVRQKYHDADRFGDITWTVRNHHC